MHGGLSVYSRVLLHLFANSVTANHCTKILDFRGFDSSIILIVRGGILMSKGNLPQSLSQQILAGRILVGRLGVVRPKIRPRLSRFPDRPDPG